MVLTKPHLDAVKNTYKHRLCIFVHAQHVVIYANKKPVRKSQLEPVKRN